MDAARKQIMRILRTKKYLIVSITLLLAWVAMTYVPLLINNRIVRLFSDYDDRAVYFKIGRWLIENTYPIGEYPQIPAYLFGINRLFSIWSPANWQVVVFSAVVSLEMLMVLFLVFKLLSELLPARLSHYAYLLLLPPVLYFTYCRFDILPAYFCLLAYSATTKRHWGMVSILLAVATFTKWYPALVFPGFFLYASKLEEKFQWKMILFFVLTSLSILLLSFLHGGLDAILAPYQFHLKRSMEYVALPVLLNDFLHGLNTPWFFALLFAIQIVVPLTILFIKIDSLEPLIHYCIMVIGTFMLLSRIWSPQWFLWLLPFLLLSAKDSKIVWFIAVYCLMNYLNYPILFDYAGSASLLLKFSSLLTYLMLFGLILRSAKNLKFENNLALLNLKNISH